MFPKMVLSRWKRHQKGQFQFCDFPEQLQEEVKRGILWSQCPQVDEISWGIMYKVSSTTLGEEFRCSQQQDKIVFFSICRAGCFALDTFLPGDSSARSTGCTWLSMFKLD